MKRIFIKSLNKYTIYLKVFKTYINKKWVNIIKLFNFFIIKNKNI